MLSIVIGACTAICLPWRSVKGHEADIKAVWASLSREEKMAIMRRLGPQVTRMYAVPDTSEKYRANNMEYRLASRRISQHLQFLAGDLNKLGGFSKAS
jgi:hypothetical protein